VKPRVQGGEVIPDISHRQIKTYEVMADEAMELLAFETIDFRDEDQRAAFRGWLAWTIGRASHDVEWSYRRAVDSALQQANALMRNPQRYERQRRNLKKARAEREAERQKNEREWQERQREREENVRGLLDAGKLAAMPGLEFRVPRPKPTPVPPVDPPPETPPAVVTIPCDLCDGAGWFASGKTDRTNCEQCNGIGQIAPPEVTL